jgi:hypothetical protein
MYAKTKLAALCLFFVWPYALIAMQYNVLTIKIINNSSVVLEKQSVKIFDGIKLEINKNSIRSHEEAIVTATATLGTDFNGLMNFDNNNSLSIFDPRQKHNIQPRFIFKSPNLTALVKFTQNPVSEGNLFKVIYVEIILTDK